MSAGYKQSQLGNMPKDWAKSTIEKEASICTGGKDTQDKIDDGVYPFFVRSNTIERINSYSFEGEAVLTSGDGVGVGKIYHYLNCKFDYHQRVYNIHNFSNNLNGRFFYYFFSNHFYGRVMRLSAKNSVDSVRRNMIAEMEIPLPPLPEQQKIAEILSTVDDKIDVIDQQINETQELKKGLMQRLLTKGIGHTEFKDSPLGKIPKSWEVVKISDIAYINKNSLPNTTNDDFEFYYIDLSSVKSGTIEFPIEKVKFSNSPSRARRILKEEDVIMATVRPNLLGFGYANFDTKNYICSTGFAIISHKENSIGQFIYQNLYSENIQNQINKLIVGSNYPAINSSDVQNIKIPCPTVKEQQKIASILSTVDEKLEVLEEKKTHYQELKQGLMQQLLTGKIRVQA
jgi:type I restriction enzyme S subunit